MARNSIKINGEKLRTIIEDEINLSIYEIATANGYSRNLVAQAIREGKASPLVQNLLRLYNIVPEEYKYKEPFKAKEPEQITIDDITPLTRAELKDLIKEALLETLNTMDWRLDTKNNVVTFLAGKDKEVK